MEDRSPSSIDLSSAAPTRRPEAWPLWKRLAIGAAGVAVVVAGVVLVKETRHYVIWDNFGVVDEGKVFRSGRLKDYQLAEAIEDYDVKTILNLGYNPSDDAGAEKLARNHGVKYVTVQWPGDGVVPPDKLDWALSVISDPANQPVLVHCARGTQRTGGVIARLRIEQGMSREAIRREMEGYRYDVDDNREMEALIDGIERRELGPTTGQAAAAPN